MEVMNKEEEEYRLVRSEYEKGEEKYEKELEKTEEKRMVKTNENILLEENKGLLVKAKYDDHEKTRDQYD